MLDSYTPYRWKGGNTHKIADNIYHLMRGEMFMFENKTFFVMGGGESEDKDMREDGVSWWKAELPTAEDLKNGQDNLREYKYAVNYVLTYEAPAIAKDFLKLHTNKGINKRAFLHIAVVIIVDHRCAKHHSQIVVAVLRCLSDHAVARLLGGAGLNAAGVLVIVRHIAALQH